MTTPATLERLDALKVSAAARIVFDTFVDPRTDDPVGIASAVFALDLRAAPGAPLAFRAYSYPGGGITVVETAAPNAEIEVRITVAQSAGLAPRDYRADLQINRRGAVLTHPGGVADVAAGSQWVTLDGASAPLVEEGAILEVLDGANAGLYVIEEVDAAGADPRARVGFTEWTTAAGLTYALRANERTYAWEGVLPVERRITDTGPA